MTDPAHRILVHQYGLGDPIDWDHRCEQQLIGQVRLWNDLVQIDRRARERYYAVLRVADPAIRIVEREIDDLLAKKDEVWERIKRMRAAARSKSIDDAVERAELDSMRDRIRTLGAALKQRRVAARKLAAPALAAGEQQRKDEVKAARQTECCGLWWCNYNAVVAAYDTARQRAIKEGAELRGHVYDGSGRLTCQIIGGMTVDELMRGEHTIASVGSALPGMRAARGRGNPRIPQSLTLTAYTERDAGGLHHRRTITWPLYLDRPLPADARIQQITAKRRRIGNRLSWTVSLLLRVPTPAQQTPAEHAACAVHIAWRRVGARGDLRVATAAGSDGSIRHLSLDADWLRRRAHVDDLQQRLDDELNIIAAWLRSQPIDDTPQPMREQIQAARRAPKPVAARFAALAVAWRDHPDCAYNIVARNIAARIETWRLADKRAREEMHNLRDKLQARRREIYRAFAAGLRARYDTVYVDGIDLAKAARLVTESDTDTPLHATARHQRVLAAAHVLRSALRGAIKIDPAHITDTCHACCTRAQIDGDDLHWTCTCGITHDRDENAARNLLAAGRASGPVASGDADSPRAPKNPTKPTRSERFANARQRAALLDQRDITQRSQSPLPEAA